jgi:hypothetical protein
VGYWDVEVKPAGTDDQEYAYETVPVATTASCVEPPRHTAGGVADAVTVGCGFTVTLTESEAEQVPFETFAM